jgi:MFS family permease
MLTGASSTLVFGKIYKFYSIKNGFLKSILVFEIGSAICGAAPNSVALIIGRAIAGLGSSGIFTGGMMIIVPLIPLRKRPIYYSLFGAVFGISSVLGPLLGGAFTDKVSWRWCFYINLPIGGFTALAIIFFLHIDTTKSEKLTLVQEINRLDPIGTFFFIPSIVCLVLALQWGGTTYSWSAPKIIGLLVTFAVLFLAFWLVQILKPDTATVPIRVVAQRSIAGGVLFLFTLTGSLMVVVYFLPIWFQAVKRDSAVQSGISLFPLVISLVVMSILSGGLTQRIGYYVPSMLASPILTSVGAGLLYTLTPTSNHPRWIGYQCLYGFGIGMALQTSSLAAQAVLSRSDISTGMALNFFAQQLGGAIFVPVAQNIFASCLVSRLNGVAGFDPQVIFNTGATELNNVVSAQDMSVVVSAFNLGATRAFLVAVGLSAGTLPAALMMEWKDIRKGAKVPAEKDSVKNAEKNAGERV